jgi:hypothetical protein
LSDLGRGIDESRTNEAKAHARENKVSQLYHTENQSHGFHIPIRVVDLALRTQELLLTGLVGKVSADLVTVFLSLEQRDQVKSGPDLLAGELVLFANTIEELVVAVGHEEVHSNEVVDGTEAAGREVALWFGLVRQVDWVFALGIRN